MALRVLLACAAATAVSAVGCGGGGPAQRSEGRRAAPPAAGAGHPLCTPLRMLETGRVKTPAASELSGLAFSRARRGVLWTHNDSGDRPRILAVTTGGRLLADLPVPGAEHVDWEAVAIGPFPGGGSAIFVGDIGDNPATRASIAVYRIPEPSLARTVAPATARAQRLELRYPDGAHDAEALLVDPARGSLTIVTKAYDRAARVYTIAAPTTGAVRTLRREGRVSLGFAEPITDGSVSQDGRTIVLRTYAGAYVWSRRARESVAAALRRRPCGAQASLVGEGQGEALALTRDGHAFETVPEGLRPVLRRYAPRR